MIKAFCFFALLTICNIGKSQIKALTDEGREVILYANGTWKYSKDSTDNSISNQPLKTNASSFTKTAGASFLVKSTTLNVGVYINPGKWTFTARKDNETSPEYRFSQKNGEGYAMMITEKTAIELESLREIALINAQKASLDVKETFAENRIVNGKKVLCLKFKGTIKGIKFVYMGYYYSNANGTIQLICFTSEQYFDGLEKELESFLNGFAEIGK